MIRRPPRSTLFPTRRSSDLISKEAMEAARVGSWQIMDRVNRWCNELKLLLDRKSTRLNSSHSQISYAVFCLKKKKQYVWSVLGSVTYWISMLHADIHIDVSS